MTATFEHTPTPQETRSTFSDIVKHLREMPQGVSGPAPRDLREYANPEAIWEMTNGQGKEWDDYTGLLDDVTRTVNKFAARRGIEPSDDLNQAIADKVSLIAGMVEISQDGGKVSQTEKKAMTRMVLNFSDDEAIAYLGDDLVNDLRAEAKASPDIEQYIDSYFSMAERLRRVSADRDAYQGSRESVRKAAKIAAGRAEFLAELGFDEPSEQLIRSLTPYNLLTLTTYSPENTEDTLASAAQLFQKASTRFPLLVTHMPTETMTIILRRGGSGKKGGIDEDRLYAYLEKKEQALRSTGDRYVAARLIGGSDADEVAGRAKHAKLRARWTHSNGSKGTIARGIAAEHFAPAEFGDDFGEKILTIVEHTTPAQSERVLAAADKLRQFSEHFGEWFRSYDAAFADSVSRAMNERFTDALTTLAAVAEAGELNVDVSPNDAQLSRTGDERFVYELHSMEEAIETLELLDTTTTQLDRIMNDTTARISRVTQPNGNFSMFRMTSEECGSAVLYIRPEGAKGYDRQYEYGSRTGVEASISFIVNPLNPQSLRPDKDPEGVSIRFDREGRTPSEAPNSPDRDPTREDGLMSLDISSIMGAKDSAATRIGRFIAAGNRLRAHDIGTHDSLHHTVLSDQRYGEAENFKRLAQYLEAGMDALAQTSRPFVRAAGRHATRSQIRRAQ